MQHILVYLIHHKFKLPVKSANPHSHSHTSVSWPKTSLSCSLLTLPIMTTVLSIRNSAHILPQLLWMLPSLQCLHWELSSEHTPFTAACFSQPCIFSSIRWTSGLGVDLLTTAFNHLLFPLFLQCHAPLRLVPTSYTTLSPNHCQGGYLGHTTHNDHSWKLQHPVPWPFSSLTSPLMAFSSTLPWSSPNTTPRTFSYPEAASPPTSLHSFYLTAHLLEMMTVPWFQCRSITDTLVYQPLYFLTIPQPSSVSTSSFAQPRLIDSIPFSLPTKNLHCFSVLLLDPCVKPQIVLLLFSILSLPAW